MPPSSGQEEVRARLAVEQQQRQRRRSAGSARIEQRTRRCRSSRRRAACASTSCRRVRMLRIVTRKLIAPASDASASRCEREDPEVDCRARAVLARSSGGYAVQPASGGAALREEARRRARSRRAGTASTRGRSAAGTPCRARRSSAARGSSRSPARIGTMTRKTIVVPCIVNSWLYGLPVTKCWFGRRQLRRASAAPGTRRATKKTRLVPM